MKLHWLAGLVALALPAVAQAHWHGGLRFSVGIGLPGIYCGPSYYCPPPPVYYAPPPPVVYQTPVYASPPVVAYQAPVVVEPPVVVYSAPPVVYGPSIGIRYYGGTRFYYRH